MFVDKHEGERLAARVVTVVNQKGGVGKTTTAINVSAGLALAGRRTLVIDLDPQGNATTGLGVHKPGLHPTIYHVLIASEPIEKAIHETALADLRLAPSDIDLVGAEIELVALDRREHRLADALRPVLDAYSYIVIDCPPSLGLLTINALAAADRVLVPLQCEFYALEGLTHLLKTVKLVRERLTHGSQSRGLCSRCSMGGRASLCRCATR